MYQSGARSPRAKGFNAKQALKISLLMAASIWLVMQVKHSHDKAKGKGIHVHVKLGRRVNAGLSSRGNISNGEDKLDKSPSKKPHKFTSNLYQNENSQETVGRDEEGSLNYKEDRASKENNEGKNDGKFEKKIYRDQAGHGEQEDGMHGFQDENGVPHDADNIIDSMPTDKDRLLHQEESLKEKNRARESASPEKGEPKVLGKDTRKQKPKLEAP